jgi:hypothetical protein
MSFEPIRKILPKAIAEVGISRQVKVAQVLDVAGAMFLQVWGEERAAFVKPVSFLEGTLKVRTLAPIAAQELKMQEATLVNELNRRLGARVIFRLSVLQ